MLLKNKIIPIIVNIKFRILVSSALILCSLFINQFELKLLFALISYIAIGVDILAKAIKNISRGSIFDENFLMSLAAAAAFFIGEYIEAVAIMLFYQTGEFFQQKAINHSEKSINSLLSIKPDYANVLKGTELIQVSPCDVKPGDIIYVKPGEKIPLDGELAEGESNIDTSALTGEYNPKFVKHGDAVLSGSINLSSLIKIKVQKNYDESTVSKIVKLMQEAALRKSPTENFITRFAKYYTPAVVLSALALAVIPPLFFKSHSFNEWIRRSLIFLVTSCPCALVLSIPLSYFAAIGAASKKGILVKGSNYLDALNNLKCVVFDKTGTLTKGKFKVYSINPIDIEKEKLLEYAAYAEKYSNHPIAASIVKEYETSDIIDISKIISFEEVPGFGVKTGLISEQLLAGNISFMKKNHIPIPDHIEKQSSLAKASTIVHIAVGNKCCGFIELQDEVKQDSIQTIHQLISYDIKPVMLTGDNRENAAFAAKKLDIDEFYADLLPADKVSIVQNLKYRMPSSAKLAFIGDGINDAPVIAASDIGIAMGAFGSDSAVDAADIVFMTDEVSKIIELLEISRKTRRIVLQNIIFVLGIKAAILLLGAAGKAAIWEAIFADVGVSIIAVLNSIRILKHKGILKEKI